MSPKLSKVLFWVPRIIGILFIPFIMMFSLEVFDEAKNSRELIVGLLIHNTPALILGIVLWTAWKWEWIGSVVFGSLAVGYIWLAWGKFDWTVYALISGPLFLMSILFLIEWIWRKKFRGTGAKIDGQPISKSETQPPTREVLSLLLVGIIALSTSGCATFRSELGGRYEGEEKRNTSKPVSVCFVFSHVHQMVGLDAIPKLQQRHQRVQGFDDIFLDAQRELSNLGTYATYTEESSDVNDPERRARKDSLITVNDYTLKIRIESKKKFSNYFLGTMASVVTATLAPIPYYQYYGVSADLYDHERRLVASYRRDARLAKWVEALLIVAYPFHPEERKKEEVYMDFLHDIFKQIESEGVLK